MADKKLPAILTDENTQAYIAEIITDFRLNPTGGHLEEMTHINSTINRDGSVSHNFDAKIFYNGDGGSKTEKQSISVSEKDGKYTLFVGDVTERQDGETKITKKVKPTGKAPEVSDVMKNLTEHDIKGQIALYNDDRREFLKKYSPQNLGYYDFHIESALQQGELKSETIIRKPEEKTGFLSNTLTAELRASTGYTCADVKYSGSSINATDGSTSYNYTATLLKPGPDGTIERVIRPTSLVVSAQGVHSLVMGPASEHSELKPAGKAEGLAIDGDLAKSVRVKSWDNHLDFAQDKDKSIPAALPADVASQLKSSKGKVKED